MRRFFHWIKTRRLSQWIKTLGLLLILGIGIGFFTILSVIKTLPSPELFSEREIPESTKIYDRTGTVLLYEIHGDEKRTVIPWEDIPKIIKDATIATEDIHFYEHAAVDWKGIIRAFLVNLRRGGVYQGGSTITQQLAKKAFLTDERTITRKLKELILAIQLERRFTKDEILHLYLNQIPYGANAYGIEAASQAFFEKPTADLTIPEAALIASIPKAPTYYSPWGTHLDQLMARQQRALDTMARLGFITEEELIDAKATELVFAKPSTRIRAPHFVIAVQEYLNNKYGEDFVRTAGLTVTTTLDWDLQQLGEKVVSEGAERNEELYKGTNAALVAENPETGEIIALVGSRDYFDTEREGNFNVATQGLRQPGSAMKPIAYITAFQAGYTPETLLFDLETEFDTTKNPEKSYKPQNFDEVFRGPISLRNALAQSINVPSVKVLYLAGIDNVLKNAASFGITTLTDRYRYGLSLVLGGGEVKLADLVSAYGVFAREGIKSDPTLVLRVTANNGTILEESKPRPQLVIDAQYARLINDILSDVEARTPLFHSSLSRTVFPGHQVALKTGTTNDYRDAWAIGYTPSLVVGVWAGNNNNEPMQRSGGSILAAVPIWSDFMKEALKDRPLEPFTRPEDIFPKKPMLNGSYTALYTLQGIPYPQIHEVLFYADKNNPLGPPPLHPETDPQFENWETPVRTWTTTHAPIGTNNPLPEGATLAEETIIAPSLGPSIAISTPANGIFVTSPINVQASISAGSPITKVEVYFNGLLVSQKITGFTGTTENYSTIITPTNLQLQNLLTIAAWDSEDRKSEESVVVYQ